MKRSEPQSLGIWRADRKGERMGRLIRINDHCGLNVHQARIIVLVLAVLAAISVQAKSQSPSLSDISSANESRTLVTPDLTYVPPTPSTMVKHYAFDAFGPYALAFTAFTAGLDQA